MAAVLKALFYLITGLILLGACFWYVRSIKDEYFGEVPFVIGPFQMIGVEDKEGKLGVALSNVLVVRISKLQQDIGLSAERLRVQRSDSGTGGNISPQIVLPLLSLPEALAERFEPPQFTATVGGVEVGGLISWLHLAFFQRSVFQVSLWVRDGGTIAAAHMESEDALWIESQGGYDRVIEEIAYALVQKKFVKQFPEARAFDPKEFQMLLASLNEIADLNREAMRGHLIKDRYAKLLVKLEGLLEKSSEWQSLSLLVATVAEQAEADEKALKLYKKSLALTAPGHPEYTESLRKIAELEKKINAVTQAALVPQPPALPPEVQPYAWLYNLLGVTSLEMTGAPLIAIIGDPPPPGEFPADNIQVLPGPPKTEPGGPDIMSEYNLTVAQAVRRIAPTVRFTFAPLASRSGAVLEPDLLRAINAAIAVKPDILLVTLGPLTARFEKIFEAAAAHQRTLVVLAAGNVAGNPIPFAGRPILSQLMVAAAVDSAGEPAPFTQSGKEAFWAPGVDIPVEPHPGKTELRTGTSYSAAIAAGVAARLLAEHPDLEPEKLLKVLRETAKPAKSDGPPIINLSAAQQRLGS